MADSSPTPEPPTAAYRRIRLLLRDCSTTERIDRYARQVEAGRGVFEPPVRDEGLTRCWCCGAVPPRRSHVVKYGWEARWLVLYGAVKVREVYCPDCFAEFGWPAVEDRIGRVTIWRIER